MILAVVLSALVLIGWGLATQYFFPAANPPATKVDHGRPVAVPQPHAGPAATTPAAIRDRRAVIAETPRVAIETPLLRGSINLKGARIDDLVLTTERQTIDRNSPPVRLFSPGGTPDAYFASFGWTGSGFAAPGPDTVWRASGTRLTPSTPVTLSWDNGRGQLFQIVFTVDENYLFSVEQRVSNGGTGPIAAQPFSLVNRVGESHDPTAWTNHVGPVGVFNGAANYDNDFKDVREHMIESARGAPLFEQGVARGARRRLKAAPDRRWRAEDCVGNCEARGGFGDELRFRSAFLAQSVIHGGRLERPGARRGGEQEQRETVRTARDRDADAPAGTDQRIEIVGEALNEGGIGHDPRLRAGSARGNGISARSRRRRRSGRRCAPGAAGYGYSRACWDRPAPARHRPGTPPAGG